MQNDKNNNGSESMFLSSKRRDKIDNLINFGIDFGTSSTKVFLREVIKGKTYAYQFQDHLEALGPFCWPSTVRIYDGRLYFGTVAEKMNYGRTIRSFKVCLACANGYVNNKQCPFKSCLINNDSLGSYVVNMKSSLSVCLHPWEIASLYIANILNILTNGLMKDPSFGLSSKYTFNMSAPLDMVNRENTRMTFEKVLYIANSMKDEIHQGIEIEKAISALDKQIRAFQKVPESAERHTFIVPETHAAMVGYVVSGKAEPGLYAAIDVGAGTTDVAIFRYSQKLAARDVAYYIADTDLIGGDDIDRAILELIVDKKDMAIEEKEKLLGNIRHLKRNYDENKGLSIYDKQYSSDNIISSVKSDLDKMYNHYKKTWGKGYQKEMRPNHWKDLYILLLGGCNQLPFVRNRISEDNPSNTFQGIIKNISVHPLQLPTDIEVLGSTNHTNINEYVSILTLAYGLSFHIAENPDYFTPHEVDPLPPKEYDEPQQEGEWWG